ncbi:serine hydrolase [Hyphobacterium sp. HN65]|uniref:Serine hydrolase n=1 Tax=Hyphobacterium lacteum TaxID=3116575 RepID=A0ABU7LPR4_9PROT|nr:serine hydrolase [Hyphobacterium sp. HN65]MEE2525329.1 serine hydrolase [Hyphobacterium sp. HN65]
MTILRWIGAGLAVIIIAGLVWLNTSTIGRIYLPTATGITAKQICSLTFVSGMDPDLARELYIDPLLGGASVLVSANVDRDDHSVHSRVLGLWHNEAVWREGLGCTLTHGSRDFDRDLRMPWQHAPEYYTLDTVHRDEAFDTAALDAAIDGAFDESFSPRNTLAVVVLHDGRLVAERYAPGFSRENRLHSWSMAKSVAATLAGAMTLNGQLDVYEPGTIELLDGLGAEGEATTIDDLLRMTGGRAAHEINDGTDPNSDMLFTETDMARFSATRERLFAPGEHWEYMSGDTVLATWEMQSRLGETLEQQVRAVRALIFEPAGIHSPVFEADASGTLQGSSYVYATPHDWARLMQIYLDDGMANGQRILPENWRDYVTTETPGSDGIYGSGFWLAPEITPQAFYMSGFQGQTTLAIPEHGLVIVRMGATTYTGTGTWTMARSVMAALND